MAGRYTRRQGQYLAFIHGYTRLHGQPPSEPDMQAYFGVSAPAVHQMVISLAQRGLIQRTPREARTIRVLLPSGELPDWSGNPPQAREGRFSAAYPSIGAWIARHGRIELGHGPNTEAHARALNEGGLVWSGGRHAETVDEWLQAMEAGVRDFMNEQGLR